MAGLLAAETPAQITLRMAQGVEEIIPRAQMARLAASQVSLMPQELERAMTHQELADLLAFVKSGGSRKIFPGNQPALLRQDDGGFIIAGAANAEIYGGDIAFEAPFQNIGMWHHAKDHVWWTAEVEKPGRFEVYLDWACHPSAEWDILVRRWVVLLSARPANPLHGLFAGDASRPLAKPNR